MEVFIRLLDKIQESSSMYKQNTPNKAIQIIAANDRHDEVLGLMREYVDWLMENDEWMGEVLANQHLEDEVADFNTKYAPPEGRLYLALADGEPAGCVGLTNITEQSQESDIANISDQISETAYTTNGPLFICEGKRLFVRPKFRGYKLGKQLMDLIIADAKEIGYKYMRLDSFPFMASAVRMYDYYGFYPIGNYCGNPSPNAIFRELKL
jgi:GNAT superfamily N-acetyltransferase